jgi:hypothetical protein
MGPLRPGTCARRRCARERAAQKKRERRRAARRPHVLLTGQLLGILQQRERQLLLPDEHCVRVCHLGAHLLAEPLQLLLADDARVAEPAAVGLDASGGQLLGLQVLCGSGRRGEGGRGQGTTRHETAAGQGQVAAPAASSAGASWPSCATKTNAVAPLGRPSSGAVRTWCNTFPLLSRVVRLLYISRRRTCVRRPDGVCGVRSRPAGARACGEVSAQVGGARRHGGAVRPGEVGEVPSAPSPRW